MAGAVLQAALLDLVRLRGFLLLVLDAAAHQKDEVGPDRPLLGAQAIDLLRQGFARQRALSRPQPLQLEQDHLLAEGVALAIRRQFESGQRHLTGAGDLDEERVAR